MTADPVRLNRIRFRAWRRGFREADLLLGGFADACAAQLNDAELTQFEDLLDQNDYDIYGWFLGRSPPPPEFDNPVVARLMAFDPSSVGVPKKD